MLILRNLSWLVVAVILRLVRSAMVLFCVVALLLTTGCSPSASSDEFRQLAERWHFLDTPPLPSVFLLVFCDPSPFSSCTPEHLRATLLASTRVLAERRGTIIVSALDETYAVREFARYTTPLLSDESVGARAAYARRVEPEAFASVWSASEPLFADPPHRSRVLAALTNIAQTTIPAAHEPILIVLSDLRDTDLIGDCRGTPGWNDFAQQLGRARFLDPGSLRARVLIPYYSLSSPAEGCASNERRAAILKELFTKAFLRAGATSVAFSTTTPTL